MRYFNLTLRTTGEQIKVNAKIKLKDYNYDDTITAVNTFFYKHASNSTSFFIYREEENRILANVAFDETEKPFSEICREINEKFADELGIRNLHVESNEITMYDFRDNLREAKRRGLSYLASGVADNARLWLYYYDELANDEVKNLPYSFSEKVISQDGDESKEKGKGTARKNVKLADKLCEKLPGRKTTKIVEKADFSGRTLYDEKFMAEIENIRTHAIPEGVKGNLVHYVLSARSMEATFDMAEEIAKNLAKAKRITSGRMEIISNIKPNVGKMRSFIEEIIENNHGGIIVFDLTERFGCEATEYAGACDYIESLLKKYRNDCLFIFTYNIDKPGFSYSLLPRLNRYVIPVSLTEGVGDREAAVGYLESLIKKSDYAKYSDQAGKFMEQIRGNKFSQTDVIRAYEKFEPWCINENILNAYSYGPSGEFFLDRDQDEESSFNKLNNMIGLELVKSKICQIIQADIMEKERKKRCEGNYESQTMHMVFQGNPGSAKTTVAKLFASIAREKGILKSGAFVERGGMDLDGMFCVSAIREAFEAAQGGVLFIDEAYSLKSDTAVTTLIQEMENERENVIVILAGYSERMKEFMEINEGLKSRIPYSVDFPDYDADELTEIFKFMAKERGFKTTEETIKSAHYIFEKACHVDNFGNGRYVRNILESAISNQASRLLTEKKDVSEVSDEDIFIITGEDIKSLGDGLQEERPAGTAKKEFEEMIGLDSAKKIVKKAIASFKLKKLYLENGIHIDSTSMHMVFQGNPGTAKTTVARLAAEILKDENVLPTGNFVEVGRGDLIGEHVGQTAPLIIKKFKEAQGGVLFVDEAYSLVDKYDGFGDEAISTIVQEMENHRDDVIVIFAGYPGPMKEFLDKNPGMKSRIAFQVDFEDYSVSELCDITKLMLSKKQLTCSENAMEKLKKNYEQACKNSDYGNGRYVRKVIEEVEMNLAARVLDSFDEDSAKIGNMSKEDLIRYITTIEESDIPEYENHEEEVVKTKMGFVS